MPKKRLLLFFTLVLVSFILMTYQSNRGAMSPIRFLSYPVNKVNETISSACSSIKGYFKKIRLRDEENKKLRDELAGLQLEHQGYKELLLENERLRGLLSLKDNEKRYVASARVIARGNNRWANTLVIDKGLNDGVAKDMAVITPKGLVGKILSVSDSNSDVLLINDINFSASIRLQDSRTEGIISGTGAKTCTLKYVSHEFEVKEKEVTLTSGLDSLFPAEIPVGLVTKIDRKGGGLFQSVEITPFQDTSKLEEVMIIRR